MVPTQRSTSTLEDISDLLDHLPIHAVAELNRQLFTSVSSPHRVSRPAGCLEDHHFCVRIW
jgi:hypothetical protein